MSYVLAVVGTALLTSGIELALGYNLVDYLKDQLVRLGKFLYRNTIGRL